MVGKVRSLPNRGREHLKCAPLGQALALLPNMRLGSIGCLLYKRSSLFTSSSVTKKKINIEFRSSKLVATADIINTSDVSDDASDAPAWKGLQPDMSDCKSKDMADLEARVRQQDPENVLVSIL
jgi:hypothetical protein